MPKQVFLSILHRPSPSPGPPVLPVLSLFDLAPASVPSGEIRRRWTEFDSEFWARGTPC